MGPRKRLFCLFCLKEVETLKKKRKRDASEITESLFNSCCKHLSPDIIGNSKNWGWEDFKRNNGPFCPSCLQSAQQLTTKNELMSQVEKEMQRFVSFLSQSIQQNRLTQVNTPFNYCSNVEIQIKINNSGNKLETNRFEVNALPTPTEGSAAISQEEMSVDCYEEEFCEIAQECDDEFPNNNEETERYSSSLTPKKSLGASKVSKAESFVKTPILKKIKLLKNENGQIQLTIPCSCGLSFESNECFAQHKITCPNAVPEEIKQTEPPGEVKKVRYRCGMCGFMAKDVDELVNHKTKHKSRTVVCKTCGEKFNSEYKLKHHRKQVHWFKHTCPMDGCEKAFKSRRLLREHGDKYHTNNSNVSMEGVEAENSEDDTGERKEKRREFICPQCGHICGSKSHLNSHMLSKHTDDWPFECSVCHKKFKERRLLDEHMQSHLEIKNYMCAVAGCGQTFAVPNYLKRHMMRNHSNNNFKCNLCGHKTLVESKLMAHMARFHDQSKNFECHVCFFRVSNLTTLKNHERIHTGEKPYSCTECDESFRTVNLLKNHKNMKHSGPQGKFKCPSCEHVAQTASDLKSHTNYKHVEEKTFSCSSCEKSFKTKDTLLTHRKFYCQQVK